MRKYPVIVVFVTSLATIFTLIYFNSKIHGNISLLYEKKQSKRDQHHHYDLDRKLEDYETSKLGYEGEKPKTVLFWGIPFGDVTVPMEWAHEAIKSVSGDGFQLESSLCGSCRFTYDKNQRNVSDAIVFHALELIQSDLPSPSLRRNEQMYVWWLQESTANSRIYTALFTTPDYFNLTMTVRRFADVYSPYGTLSWILKLIWSKNRKSDLLQQLINYKSYLPTENFTLLLNSLSAHSVAIQHKNLAHIEPEIRELIEKKNRMAAWVASNCKYTKASLLRRRYAKHMKFAGLRIDMLGGCGDSPYPIPPRWHPDFYELLSRYKFYLTMENSYHCRDYITEKLWLNALYSGAVPVIFGPHRRDIEAILPPKSYIHVDDFPNHIALVRYLRYLDKNVTAYAEYLEWRTWTRFLNENGEFSQHRETGNPRDLNQRKRKEAKKFAQRIASGFCALCRKLHTMGNDRHVVRDVNQTWVESERPECYDYELAREKARLPKNVYDLD